MTATLELRCHNCAHRFGRRARTVVLFATFALCRDCADNIELHRRLFFSCPVAHTPLEHGGTIATTGRARQLLNSTTL